MYLLDQHAAHERILFEKFASRKAGRTRGAEPARSTAGRIHAAGRLSRRRIARRWRRSAGLEPFGKPLAGASVPAILSSDDIRAAMADLVADLLAGDVPFASTEEEKLITRVCKRAAIKAGQALSHQEMQELVRQLEACRAPRTCPHGRPTMIHLSAEQLAREFGRR
jgi:DNA mismatch repair protein MutL